MCPICVFYLLYKERKSDKCFGKSLEIFIHFNTFYLLNIIFQFLFIMSSFISQKLKFKKKLITKTKQTNLIEPKGKQAILQRLKNYLNLLSLFIYFPLCTSIPKLISRNQRRQLIKLISLLL